MDEVIKVWKEYLETIEDWQSLTKRIQPKATGCGPLYEIPNPINRPNESFAIADMRNLNYVEPHYHINGDTEIQIILQGLGLLVKKGVEEQIGKGSIVVIPPEIAYFLIPQDDLVLAAINTPPFKPEDYVSLSETNIEVGFDKDQFERLLKEAR